MRNKTIRDLPVPIQPGEVAADFDAVQDYLRRFGHLQATVTPNRLDEPTSLALVSFQTFYGIDPTGEFDVATRSRMERPRCGHRDLFLFRGVRTSPCFWQPLPAEASFAVGSIPGVLDRSAVVAACQSAFGTWALALGNRIEFQHRDTADVDFEVAWRSSTDPDGGLDEDSWGHSDSPVNCVDRVAFARPQPIHLNRDFGWSLSAAGGRRDVESGVLHEIGHLLGLDHYGSRNVVMHPDLEEGVERRALEWEDEVQIGLRYP